MAENILATNNKDALLYGYLPTTAFGTSDVLYIAWRSNVQRYGRSIINFTLPSGSGTISKVELFLKEQQEFGSNTSQLNCHTLNRTDWVESEVTNVIYKAGSNWTSAGGDFNSTIIAHCANPHLNGWVNFILMGTGSDNPLTLNWGDTVNVLMKSATESGGSELGGSFYSKENATSGNRPYIKITYTEPSGGSAFLLLFV